MTCVTYSKLAAVRLMCTAVWCSGIGCQGQTTPKTNPGAKSDKVVVDAKKAPAKEVQEHLPVAAGTTAKGTAARQPGMPVDGRHRTGVRRITSNNKLKYPLDRARSADPNSQSEPPYSGDDDHAAEDQAAKLANEQASYTEMVTELAERETQKQSDIPFYKWLDGVLNKGQLPLEIKLAVSAVSDREFFLVTFVAGVTFVLVPLSVAMLAAAFGRKCASYRPFLVSAAIGGALVAAGTVGPETFFKVAVYAGPWAFFFWLAVILLLGGFLWGLAGPVHNAKNVTTPLRTSCPTMPANSHGE